MIDTTQSQADIDDQFWSIVANETSRGSNDGARVNVSTEAWREYEEQLARKQLVEHHLSDASIAGAASPNLIELTDPDTSLDPRLFTVAGVRFGGSSAEDIEVSEVFQPKTLLEQQIEALSHEQKCAVIADITAYIPTIRLHKLQTFDLRVTTTHQKR